MDVFDDHLARRDRAQHFLADRFFGDLFDEIAGDGQRHVGLEQRDANLAHRGAHVGLGKRAAPPQPVEYAAEPIAQRVEHSSLLRCRGAHMGSQMQIAPADETSLAGVHPWALNIDVCLLGRGGA